MHPNCHKLSPSIVPDPYRPFLVSITSIHFVLLPLYFHFVSISRTFDCLSNRAISPLSFWSSCPHEQFVLLSISVKYSQPCPCTSILSMLVTLIHELTSLLPHFPSPWFLSSHHFDVLQSPWFMSIHPLDSCSSITLTRVLSSPWFLPSHNIDNCPPRTLIPVLPCNVGSCPAM